MKNLYNKVGEMEFDGLITDINPAPIVHGRTIRQMADAEATLKRGTILAKGADGKLGILGTNAGDVTEDFSGNGTATTFTLTASPLPLYVKSAKVGTASATISAYNAQTGVVTLSVAPAAGTDNVHITYENPAADVADCILCDDVTVGTTADETVPVYLAGCFDPDKCIVAEDYTITEADKDALRERGIIFKAASSAE